MFERVRIRLTVLTVVLFMCLYALSSAAVYSIVRHMVIQGIDGRLNDVARNVEQLGTIPSQGNSRVYVFAQAPGGTVITNAPKNFVKGIQRLAERRSTTNVWYATWTGPKGTRYRVLSLPQSGGNGQPSFQVLIAQDISDQLSVLSPLEWVILFVGIAGSLIAGGAGFWWAGRALHPIRTAWDRQLRFVSDASHELRTPLAVIQSNLDLVLDHTDQSVEENLEWVDNAQSEARRLTRLVQDLLTLARSDSNTVPIQMAPVELAEVVQHVADLFEPVAEMNEKTLSVDNGAYVTVEGDYDRLAQLIVILVDNAFKYTGTGGHVTISTSVQKNRVLLSVADNGPGIDAADLPHVFERFYRADKARARGDDQGTGLGLSIAQWIAQAHHGKIQIDSTAGQGTTVTVNLPAQDQTRDS